MHLSIKSWHRCMCHVTISILLLFLGVLSASALLTGIPLRFNIDPATIRQQEEDETLVLATVVLKAPSPNVFVCQIRSGDKDKVTFTNIVFKKGQMKGTASGIVHWHRILDDCEVKLSAFSVDAPGEKLWFTVALKTKDQNQSENDLAPSP